MWIIPWKPTVDHNRRPSVYLQERAEEFGRVLEFFSAPHHGQGPGSKERLVVFLTQLGFWDWELENLIYAYSSFEERVTAWEHDNGFGLANALRTKGLWIRTTAVKDLKFKRQAREGKRREVFAPVPSLNNVIAQWNDLLTRCEEQVLITAEEREVAIQSGVDLVSDLEKYRKPLLPA